MKYLVSKNEDIGCLPYGSIILNAKILCKGINNDALVYLPKKIKYKFEDKIDYKDGCGSLSFGVRNSNGLYIRSERDFMNVNNHKYE